MYNWIESKDIPDTMSYIWTLNDEYTNVILNHEKC